MEIRGCFGCNPTGNPCVPRTTGRRRLAKTRRLAKQSGRFEVTKRILLYMLCEMIVPKWVEAQLNGARLIRHGAQFHQKKWDNKRDMYTSMQHKLARIRLNATTRLAMIETSDLSADKKAIYTNVASMEMRLEIAELTGVLIA